MGNRTGTYVIFAAEGKTDPTDSDMAFYNTLNMWKANKHIDFSYANSHEKTGAVRDSSKKETLRRALVTRMNCSKNALLIIGDATRFDTDWVPFEIVYVIDTCKIPVIVAYPGERSLQSCSHLEHLWPQALASRVQNDAARTIQVPFRLDPIQRAISQFGPDNLPKWNRTFWTAELYREWGLLAA